MENGKKYVLAGTAALILAVGGELALIHHRNNEEAPVKKDPYADAKIDDDDAVGYTLHKERPDSLKDERTLIGRTVWMSAGGQLDYYRYAAHHVDYAHPVDTIAGAEPMIIKDVFEQVAPKTGRAVFRIPAGQRHVLLAFTMPNSADPKALYATPVGHYEGGQYDLLNDQIFFYDDPHKLYKHWTADAWAHVDKHEVVPGMSEAQAMMALGQVMTPSSDNRGNRTVSYDNNGHPVTVYFEKNKAITVTSQK